MEKNKDKIIKELERVEAIIPQAQADFEEKKEELERLQGIKQKCEDVLVLIGEFETIEDSGSDITDLLIADNLRNTVNFDSKFNYLIHKRKAEIKRQLDNAGREALKKEEAEAIEERIKRGIIQALDLAGENRAITKLNEISIKSIEK